MAQIAQRRLVWQSSEASSPRYRAVYVISYYGPTRERLVFEQSTRRDSMNEPIWETAEVAYSPSAHDSDAYRVDTDIVLQMVKGVAASILNGTTNEAPAKP